jgi:hypothetical protein
MYLSKITGALEEACKRLVKECGADISGISYRSQAAFDQETRLLVIATVAWVQKNKDISVSKVTLLNEIIDLMLLLESGLKRSLDEQTDALVKNDIQSDLEFLSKWSKDVNDELSAINNELPAINNELPAIDERNLDNDRRVINIASKYLEGNPDLGGNNDALFLDYKDLFFYRESRKVCDKNYSTPWWLKVAMMRIERAVTPKESIPLRRVRKPKSPQTRYFRTIR